MAEQQLELELYILGHATNSRVAVANLRRLCEQHLKGGYVLRVVDVLENPEVAEEANIVATPTLIKRAPKPLRRMIGDLSHTEAVLSGLGIEDDNRKVTEKPTP